MTDKPKTKPRRRYDSPLRRKRAAETRQRIILAGAELLHDFPVWAWHELTVRAVADRAGVNERTVYRHFENEKELREAVMARHQVEAGVDMDELTLDNLHDIVTRTLEYVSTFPIEPRSTPKDLTLMAAGKKQRGLMLNAVTNATEGWTEKDRTIAAAMMDAMRSVSTFERLVADWGLEPKDAIRAITWVMDMVEEAIRNDERPKR